jgi:HNH endonuclease
MPINRAPGRNVHIYDASAPDVVLGGLIQNGSVTENNFLDMLGILLVSETPLRVQERTSGHVVTATNSSLQPGEYDVYCDSRCSLSASFDCFLTLETARINVNDEPWVHRIFTHSVSGRADGFRHGVRARDGKCVMSGIVNARAQYNIWSGFETAHIFPLESESLWIEHDYGRWIRDVTPEVSKINSRQNGFLLYGGIHTDFVNYLISVNPDVSALAISSLLLILTGPKDNYKIIMFGIDLFGLDGRTLDPVCRDPENPHSVSDQLLRWHFRQSVLANMRGAGEPIFEHDFPSGTDMIGEIHEGPYAKERLEMEFSARLRGVSQS